MHKKTLVTLAAILGIIFIAIGAYYWLVPAGQLASFVPGYLAGSTHIHFNHGLAAMLLGALSFLFAWMNSGPSVAHTL